MVHSSCTDMTQATVHLVIVLESRIQKSGTGANNFVKGDILVWLTKMTSWLVKLNHLQGCSQIFRLDQTEN